MINLHEPKFLGNEKRYLNECLKSGWISTSGTFINKFEEKIKKYTKSRHCVAMNSCTSSLHLALKLVGVKKDDEVITSTISFISPINAIKYNNANPIFMDVDENLNIDELKTIDFINNETFFKNGFTYNKYTKKRISAIIIIHVFGNAVKFDELFVLSKKRNIKIIEDAAESLGTFFKKGKFKNKHTGTVGDIGCLSFNGNKIITSGGGGSIITNNRKYKEQALYLASQAKNDSINFIHNNIGYNYRISNLHASIGLGQFESINKILKLKKNIHKNYNINFKNFTLASIISSNSYSKSNYWLNILKLTEPNRKLINKIVTVLQNKNIILRPLWKLNHLQNVYLKSQKYKIEKANIYSDSILCLPSSFFLKNKEVIKISNLIKKVIESNK